MNLQNGCRHQAPRFRDLTWRRRPLPTVRIALFGLGNRGSSLIDMLEWLIGQGHAEITAISDINPDKIQRALDRIAQFQTNAPRVFTGDDNAWKEACTTDVADMVLICTPWEWHTQ